MPRPQWTVQVRKMIFGSMIPIDLIVYTPKEIDESKDNKFVHCQQAVEKYLKAYLFFQSTAFRFSHDLIFSLRDDHGKDVLEAFSKIIVRSPYVIEIINSIPFNPYQRKFIKNVSNDGKIEIVLTHTDPGLGLVLQTTGRNYRETEKIAQILNLKYARWK